MPQINNKATILLALQVYKNDLKLSLRRAAKFYQVNHTTLLCRHNCVQARANTITKPCKLSNLEEKIVIRYIRDLNLRGFPLRLGGVEEIANRLLEMYQCHMSLTSVYLQKYLLIFYLSRNGKKTKRRSKNKSLKPKT